MPEWYVWGSMGLASAPTTTPPPGTVLRFDTFVLDTARRRRDTDGALIVPGRLARTGIQIYRDANGRETREYRPAEEVFDAASIATFEGLVITDGHPPEGIVTPETFRAYARGHITRPRRDGDWLVCDFVICDAELIRQVENGEKSELSGGYFARLEHTSGRTDAGEPYDAIQRGIRGNHAAVIPAGWARAGREARLLDSVGNESPPMAGEERSDMEEIQVTIGGKAVTIKVDAASRAVVEGLVAEAGTTRRERDEARARADATATDLAKAQAEIAKRDAADAAVKRAELEGAAKTLVGDQKLDCSGSDRELRLRALGRVGAEVRADESDDYIRAAFDLEARKVDGTTVRDAVAAIQAQQTKGGKGARFGKLRAARAAAMGGDR